MGVVTENKQKKCEEKITSELKDIRNEMLTNYEVMKDTIAEKVINQLKPIIPVKVDTLNAEDVKKIVEEVLEQRKPTQSEAPIDEATASSTEEESVENINA